MRRLAFAAVLLLTASPARAQFQFHDVNIRPFLLLTGQRFAAQTTFNAVFGSAAEPFWGGGIDVVWRKKYFLDAAWSRMFKTGQRVFISNGEVFPLGIQMRTRLTPIELTAGYRFRTRKSRITPFAGAGVGTYAYREQSDFTILEENMIVSHAGWLVTGGAEFRVAKWIAVAGDAQYTGIPGIYGQRGVSKEFNEDSLGGVAARLRVLVGR